jgi:hypothetical protein
MIPKRGNKYIDVGNGMNKETIVVVTDSFNSTKEVLFKVIKLGYNGNLSFERTYRLPRGIFNKQFKPLNKKIKRIE